MIVIGDDPVSHGAAEVYCADMDGSLVASDRQDDALAEFREFGADIWPASPIKNAWMADRMNGEYLMLSITGATLYAEPAVMAYPICVIAVR